MSHLRTILVGAFTLLWILGCGGLSALEDIDFSAKPPPSEAYVGDWEGPGMSVQILPDGMVAIERRDGNTTSVRAPAQAWRPDGLEVGVGSFTTTYRIDETPHEVDGRWRMVIEGVMLERVAAPAPEETPEAVDAPPAEAAPDGDEAAGPEAVEAP